MASSNSQKHLIYGERQIIETGITNGSKKSAIASTLGKDPSTIAKEIRLHATTVHRSTFFDCANYSTCKPGKDCIGKSCENYTPFVCNRRDRSPGACNGCSKYRSCRHDKKVYKADEAQREYEETLISSRSGIDMTYSEAKEMADVVVPLIKAGNSPYKVVNDHPELGICEKTLYNYIEEGVFSSFGLLDVDLRDKVRRRIPKKVKAAYKKREDKTYLKGRYYKDFEEYIKDNEDTRIVEMDTVYNDVTNGPFLQTFKFLSYGFTFAFYHDKKTAEEMKEGIDSLYALLGKELFFKEVHILLTDRGSEFSDATGMENDEEGNLRTRVFYCDPMASCQKGSLENKHREYRDILPSGSDLKELGLNSQEDLNIVLSHINSASLKSLMGKSALETMKFYNQDLYQKFIEFGIKEIEKDKIILKPYLLKKEK